MSKLNVEQVKAESQGLRGPLSTDLESADAFLSEAGKVLIKFHGSYEQTNRDKRGAAARARGRQRRPAFLAELGARGDSALATRALHPALRSAGRSRGGQRSRGTSPGQAPAPDRRTEEVQLTRLYGRARFAVLSSPASARPGRRG